MLGMAAAAVLEIIRLGVVGRHGMTDVDPSADGSPAVPISVWWQVRARERRGTGRERSAAAWAGRQGGSSRCCS